MARKVLKNLTLLLWLCGVASSALVVAPALAYAFFFPGELPPAPGAALVRILLALLTIALEVWEWLWHHRG